MTWVSQKPGDDDTNETNYMYGLMTISEIPLQRYNKKLRFPNFQEYPSLILRQSAINVKNHAMNAALSVVKEQTPKWDAVRDAV